MAQRDFSGLSPVLATKFAPRVAEQINRAAPLLMWLPKVMASGKNVNIAVQDNDGKQASTAMYMDPGSDISTFSTDGLTHGYIEYANAFDSFTVTNEAIDKASVTNNPEELKNLVGYEFMKMMNRLAVNMEIELFSGNGGVVSSKQTIAGLLGDGYVGDTGALAADNTYLNIDRSQGAHAHFNSNVLLNGGSLRDISLALLEKGETAVYQQSGGSVDAWWTDPVQWEKLADSFVATTTQFVDPGSGKQELVYQAGSNKLIYRGVPIFKSPQCPAGVAIGLSRDALRLEMVPVGPRPSALSHGTMEIAATAESQFGGGAVGLVAHIQELSSGGDYTKFMATVRPQLVVERPNRCVVIGDLHTSY